MGATVPGPLGSQTYRRKRRFDRVRRPDMYPVLCREIVEGQQLLAILAQLLHGSRILRPEPGQGPVECLVGFVSRLGHPDFMQRGLNLRLHRFGQR